MGDQKKQQPKATPTQPKKSPNPQKKQQTRASPTRQNNSPNLQKNRQDKVSPTRQKKSANPKKNQKTQSKRKNTNGKLELQRRPPNNKKKWL